MRWIPPGRFMMGSPDAEGFADEQPRHEVTITRGFWLGETPVTQAMWTAVMGHNPSRFTTDTDLPMENVSWSECMSFCEQLNKRIEGLRVGLPTEAQWEYACRAGAGQMRYPGSLDDIAWYLDNSGGKTHPVGEKQPNAFGLYDMLGNVWEWCRDGWWSYDAVPQQDPVGPERAGVLRVYRGGSWAHEAGVVRAASRYPDDPGIRHQYLGLRLARGQEQPAEGSAG